VYIAALYMAALGISILSPVNLLPGGEIDVHRVPLLGIHNGETLFEFPGLDELTSARVLGRDGPYGEVLAPYGRFLGCLALHRLSLSLDPERTLRDERTSKRLTG
jgi:hypothetical protein